MQQTEIEESDFTNLQSFIYESAGIRIADHKRTLVSNRLRRRLRATGHESFSTYVRYLHTPQGKDELPHFLDEITTNETYFFRDENQYEWLEKEFFPGLARSMKSEGKTRQIKIWSAASSSGEEPYGIALCALQSVPSVDPANVKIIGTDLSNQVLEKARAGIYDTRSLQLVSPLVRKKYFEHQKDGERWALREQVRKLVTFQHHNLMKPMQGGPFQCIFIKNVLIYFDEGSKRIVVDHLLKNLVLGGYLVVGPAEGIFKLLDPLTKIKTWLYRKDT